MSEKDNKLMEKEIAKREKEEKKLEEIRVKATLKERKKFTKMY